MKLLTILALQLLIASGCLALPINRVETNPELTAGFFEGDMIIDPKYRNVLRDKFFRWPRGIVFYTIDLNIDQDNRNQILRAIRIIEQNSCVMFREAFTDQIYYVKITSNHRGCFSTVGFMNRVQDLNLERNSDCFNLGSIIHELLHTLGFYHQHSAANRDIFVRILYENIQSDKLQNFYKHNGTDITDFGMPYDYGSIMHYPPYAYSKNNEKTIESIFNGGEQHIGQRIGMSYGDISKLNMMYNCRKSNGQQKNRS